MTLWHCGTCQCLGYTLSLLLYKTCSDIARSIDCEWADQHAEADHWSSAQAVVVSYSRSQSLRWNLQASVICKVKLRKLVKVESSCMYFLCKVLNFNLVLHSSDASSTNLNNIFKFALNKSLRKIEMSNYFVASVKCPCILYNKLLTPWEYYIIAIRFIYLLIISIKVMINCYWNISIYFQNKSVYTKYII